MNNTTIRALTMGAATLALAGAAYAGTAIGHADSTTDQVFVEVLHEHGITHSDGDAMMIGAGHDICTNMDNGYTATQQITTVHRVSGLDWGNSGYFVGASIASYCPEYM